MTYRTCDRVGETPISKLKCNVFLDVMKVQFTK